MSSLARLQQQMAAAVMRPLPKNETTRRRGAHGHSVESVANLLIKPNDRLTSLERLEIYNRQYWFRLFSSFEEDFPGVKAIVGSRRFERMMRAYLEAHPSQSFTLRNLGCSLVQWLSRNAEYTAPHSEAAIAMATLEWAHIEAFDSAELPPLTPEQIAGLTDDSRLALQPFVQLLECPYAVDDALIAIKDTAYASGTQASNAVSMHVARRTRSRRPRRQQIRLAVHRHKNTVYYKRLSLEDYQLLSAFAGNAALGEAVDAAFFGSTLKEEEQLAQTQASFQYFMQMGWLCEPPLEPL